MVLIINEQQSKSEQSFAITSAKRVVIFQACLQLAREEAAAKITNKNKKHSISQRLKCLCEEGHCKLK